MYYGQENSQHESHVVRAWCQEMWQVEVCTCGLIHMHTLCVSPLGAEQEGRILWAIISESELYPPNYEDP